MIFRSLHKWRKLDFSVSKLFKIKVYDISGVSGLDPKRIRQF